jgi:hypothetical protein
MTKPWTRLLWGIEFTGTDGKPILIGAMWDEQVRTKSKPYPGEPNRALLFTTRRGARDWCVGRNAEWKFGASTRKWRVRPVRVVETVRVHRA